MNHFIPLLNCMTVKRKMFHTTRNGKMKSRCETTLILIVFEAQCCISVGEMTQLFTVVQASLLSPCPLFFITQFWLFMQKPESLDPMAKYHSLTSGLGNNYTQPHKVRTDNQVPSLIYFMPILVSEFQFFTKSHFIQQIIVYRVYMLCDCG